VMGTGRVDPRSVVPLENKLSICGYALLTLSGSVEQGLADLEKRLSEVGTPLHVFRRHSFWKPLDVDPTRPRSRSGGVGLNSLHIDCVNTGNPPDVVCLYCERPDPLGGGANVVVPFAGVETELPSTTRRVLARHRFQDGVVVDLDGVGDDVNPFAVLDPRSTWKLRYTGRLLEGELNPAELRALVDLDQALWHRAQVFDLHGGQALVVNQRLTLHGRLPLGVGQESMPANLRRRLLQAYWRFDV
jgi:hypothetical protein